MKYSRIKILSFVAAFLVCIITCGLTVAYFSDYDTAKGNAELKLGSDTQIEEKWDSKEKRVSIGNIGDTRVIVRVAVYGPQISNDDGTIINYVTYDPEYWVKKGDYYYYKYVLEPKASTASDIVAKTDLLQNADLGDTYDIVVNHFSAQVAYDGNGNIIVPDGWNAEAVAQIIEE